ncbi:MAG TPA: PCYCGC motif-containing (lipo)protein [Thermoanaerobaculia bacterium]|nr:PCYCGC motif-containing (lipo)protein [Thermoanaerobaculia bacterium]
MRARFLLVAAVLATGALAAAPTKRPAPGKAAPPPAAPKNSCEKCVERGQVLDPARFSDTRIYEREVKPAYEIARKYPQTLDRIHCFCECQESMTHRHKTLLTCFTSEHAAGCGICIREAMLAGELKDKGVPDDQIENTVESLFKTDGHRPTHAHPG